MNEQVTNLDTDVAKTLGLELKPRRFWRARRVLAAVLIVLALVGGGAFYFWGGTGPTTYVTAEVTRGPLTVAVSATGTLQPQDQVDVGAEISGRVDAVNVDFNDRVRKGQVLAVINTDQIRAQLAQAQASLAANRAAVVTAEATVRETLDRRDRARALFNNNGLISAQDLRIAEAAYDRAVASVERAKADVDNAAAQITGYQTSLNKAQVRSPIDGVVLERRVATGQTVAASFQTPVLFSLASDLATMQLAVDIDEADIGVVREGQTAHFTVDAYPQRQFDARLISLRNLPKTANGVVTYQGVLTVDNSAKLLRPGLTATASILISETKEALLVPNGALRFAPPAKEVTAPAFVPATNGETVGRVWVLQDGKPVARDLRIGHSDGRNTEVVSGDLKASERVITDIAAPPVPRARP
jgi:HlyD family secretion protein